MIGEGTGTSFWVGKKCNSASQVAAWGVRKNRESGDPLLAVSDTQGQHPLFYFTLKDDGIKDNNIAKTGTDLRQKFPYI